MANFSLRGIDDNVNQALKDKASRLGISVNALILNCIHKGIGVGQSRRVRHHDLDRLAGTWSDAESNEFMATISEFETVDEELWK